MLKIGILGCGRIAQTRHIPEYAANPACVLTGFYNPTASRAADMAAKYGGRVYDTAQALIADPEIDAVSVCSANYAHAALTIQALRAGKHVLCEKPMATTIADCEAMVKAAGEAKRFLMIAQNQRLMPAHEAARRLLQAGELGRVLSFRTCFGHGGPEQWSVTPGKGTWFFDKDKAAMGAMADLGIHKTDLIQYLLGQRVVRTTARLTTLDKRGSDGELIGVDDNAVCIYEMQDGTIGTMSASWTCYGGEENATVIYGTQGVLHILEDPAHALVLQKAGEAPKFIDPGQPRSGSGIIDLWVDCLLNGREPPISGESVLSAMRAVFASIESSETGRTVEIPENRLPQER